MENIINFTTLSFWDIFIQLLDNIDLKCCGLPIEHDKEEDDDEVNGSGEIFMEWVMF